MRAARKAAMPIYLDHNATTPIADEVAAAMVRFLSADSAAYGNPSSTHLVGRAAHAALEEAREQVAASIGAKAHEIVFTGCGSEANNLALIGTAKTRLRNGERVRAVTTTIEHPAVFAPLEALVLDFPGRVDVERVPVFENCRLDLDAFAASVDSAHLASVMLANNETGTIQPVADASRLARAQGAVMHVDAAQAMGKIAVDVDTLGADLLTIVGHKFGAPKGIAALYVREKTPLVPLIFGAGHERGRRAGTENTLLATALGVACAHVAERIGAMTRVAKLRDRFELRLREALGEKVVVNGDPSARLPNTLHVSLLGVAASRVLEQLPQIAASTGSACHEGGKVTLSPVLAAMGVSAARGAGAFRFSLGPTTTQEDVDEATRLLLEHLDANAFVGATTS